MLWFLTEKSGLCNLLAANSIEIAAPQSKSGSHQVRAWFGPEDFTVLHNGTEASCKECLAHITDRLDRAGAFQ